MLKITVISNNMIILKSEEILLTYINIDKKNNETYQQERQKLTERSVKNYRATTKF